MNNFTKSKKFIKIVKMIALIIITFLPFFTFTLGRWYEVKTFEKKIKQLEFEVRKYEYLARTTNICKTETSTENINQNKKYELDKIEFDGLISEAEMVDCDIFIKSTNGNDYRIFGLESLGGTEKNCIKNPHYAISKSGDFFVFENVSGGVDTVIQIFSTKTKVVNTLFVLGPSVYLTEIIFLENNVLETRTKNVDSQEEVSSKYDIDKLYSNFPNNVNEYGYFTDIK